MPYPSTFVILNPRMITLNSWNMKRNIGCLRSLFGKTETGAYTQNSMNLKKYKYNESKIIYLYIFCYRSDFVKSTEN